MNTVDCDLHRCFLCQHCSSEWKELVSIRKVTLSFRKGQKIFAEGDLVEGIFFIYEGAVKVSKSWEADKELILRFAGPGDVLGHRGFGTGFVYPISATVLEDTRACYIDSQFLEASFKTNPALTYRFLDLYANELQQAEKRMRDLAHRDGRGRIILALFEAEKVFGTDEKGFLRMALTRQDIASFAGTSYETVFKVFSEWSASGLLSFSGKAIRINDYRAFGGMLKEEPVHS
jgi:CRP-like cAMP-binding protein